MAGAWPDSPERRCLPQAGRASVPCVAEAEQRDDIWGPDDAEVEQWLEECGAPTSRHETLPVPGWVSGYERGWLRGDVLAGITVTAYLIPR